MKKATIDPVTFEVLRHKFWQAAEEMGVILIQASSSPVVTEVQDFATALFAPNGDFVAMGSNVIPHVAPMQFAVRSVMDECSDNPGINEGDAFIVNDPHRGAMHQSDIIITAPIHYQGKLVGWTACHCHHLDVGAMIPGGFTIGAREIYQEGIRLPPVKLIERGVIRKDLWTMLFNHIRIPRVALDLKAQIAANNIGGRRLVEMCEKYGAETVEAGMAQLLDHSEAKLRARLKELPDGTFRHIDRQDHDGLTPGLYRIVLAVEKDGDALHFDFTGSSAQTPGFVNCCIGGAWAGVCGVLLPWLAYDMPWNAGLLRPVRITAPDGSICNAKLPAPVSKGGTGTMWSIRNAAQLCLSKLMGCSEHYHEEAMAIWQGAVPIAILSGQNQFGEYFGYLNMDGGAGGCGAVAVRDGTNTAGNQVSPTMSIPNIETHEVNHPVLYMFRRQRLDSAGAGKFRGGAGLEEMFVVYDADHVDLTLTSNGIAVANSEGLFGGLPGASNYWGVARVDDGSGQTPPLFASLEEVPGELEPLGSGLPHFRLARGEMFYMRCTGGGGYGDPLDRDPGKVMTDIGNALLSPAEAERVYGVVPTAGGLRIDAAATQARREAIRQARLAGRGGDPVMPANRGERIGRRGEYIDIVAADGATALVCRRCGCRLGTCQADLRATAIVRDVPLGEAGPLFPDPASTECALQLYACPGCGVQFGAQIVEKSGQVLDDIELRSETLQ
ncbi:MAG TPA: hydantoinase B/oxoprolinase family protein [Alphaproteobacteria bacterium]|nr:hydantoinase B/oxoprolinase family protein [Alphaproteobacteria bacterium]